MAICPKCLTPQPDDVTVCPHDGVALVPDDSLAVDPELEVGTKVGEYVIEAKIGAGTFGVVYRGIQPLIGKQVAVKVLSRKYSADPLVVSRFIAEARAVNQIRHNNIIDIFSFGQLPDGRHYHVMELLEGQPLDEYLASRGGRLPIPVLVPILRGLARALDAAHASGIAHRDLKPANVFLARDEEGTPFPKLLDFGIAKLLTDDVPRQHTTATGTAVGTPDYMSPEQCQGPDVDHRTDIYAFGVMTYQLVTGHLPFTGKNVVEVLMKQMTEPPRPPSEVGPDIPATLDPPILGMMAKAPEERPDNLQRAVQQLTEAAVQAGYAVPLPAQSGEVDASMVRSGPGAVPSATPMHSTPGLADTLPSRDVPAQTPPPKRSTPIWIGVAIMVVAVAAVPFLLDGGTAPPEPETPPKVAETPPAPPPPPAAPAAPTTVRFTLTGAPEGAAVTGPEGAVWDAASGVLEVPLGTAEVELRVEAEGYRAWSQRVVPTDSATIAVALKKVPKRRPPRTRPRPKPDKPHKDDLEVPSWGE